MCLVEYINKFSYEPNADEFRRYWTRARQYNKIFLERFRLVNEEIREAILFDINYKIRQYTSVKKATGIQKVSDFFANWDCIIYKGQRNFIPIIINGLKQGGDRAIKLAETRIAATFDAFNPRAIKYCTKESLKLITVISEQSKLGIQEIMKHGMTKGKSIGYMASDVRDITGLDRISARAYINYKDRLIQQGITGKKFDKLVKIKKIDLHNYRAIRIARTEANRMINNGAVLGYQDAGYESIIWAGGGGNICEYCESKLGTEYDAKDFLGMLPAHPNCQCYPRRGTRKKSIITTIGVA